MTRNKQLTINLVASIIAFFINMGISFFLTPYITKNIGVEAYGFVSLGTQFINYASLVTIALNSMAGRFVMIEIYKKNWESANKYFNSVLLSNVIIAAVMLIPSIFIVVYLEILLDIPLDILVDIKVLFTFLFTNYLISIMVSSFGVSTFATNKLYLKSFRETEARVLQALLLTLLFILFEPAVSYLGFAAVIVMIYIGFFNIYYTKKFLPKLKISKAYFKINSVFELINSGIWNTVSRLGQILSSGLDLLIANVYIGSDAMGILALAKTIPLLIASLIGVVAGVFMPEFTQLYANNDTKSLLKAIKKSIKILSVISIIPLAFFIVYGDIFFILWVPEQKDQILYILAIISIASVAISGPLNSLFNIFTVTNRLKVISIVMILSGLINLIIVFSLLRLTNLGIYAVAGVSSSILIIKNLVIVIPLSAKYLGLKWNTFFKEIFQALLLLGILIIIGFISKLFFNVEGWLMLFGFAGLISTLGLLIGFIFILNKAERMYIMRKIKDIF